MGVVGVAAVAEHREAACQVEQAQVAQVFLISRLLHLSLARQNPMLWRQVDRPELVPLLTTLMVQMAAQAVTPLSRLDQAPRH